MKCTQGGAGTLFAAAALLAVLGTEVSAQSVESIMRARDRLELTEEQLGSLDAIRREIVLDRAERRAELSELRSQLEAGEIRRSDLMAAMEDGRERTRQLADQRRERVDAVLTEAQLESVQQMRRRAVRGRAGVGRRGGRDFRRGRPGIGPRGRSAFDRGGFGPPGRRGFRAERGPRRGPGRFGPR